MLPRWMLLLATVLCPLLSAADAPDHDLTKDDIQQRFARPLTVEFKKQPLDAVLSLFMEFTKTTILTDPELAKLKPPPINFSATDAPIMESFVRALDAAGADWAVFDNAVFVFKKGAYNGDPERLTRPFSDADTKTFAKAVDDLRDTALSTRDDASKTIAQFGAAAIPALKNALLAEKDPEAIDRLKTLLKTVSADRFLEPLGPGVAKELERRAEIVNAWYSDGLLKCVDTLNETAHARISAPETVPNTEINLRIVQMPAHSVLIWVARYTGTILSAKSGRLYLEPKQAGD